MVNEKHDNPDRKNDRKRRAKATWIRVKARLEFYLGIGWDALYPTRIERMEW